MANIKEQIRAEVERLRDEHEKAARACSGLNVVAMTHGGAQKVCDEILAFIDSLPDEKPSKDLETEIDRLWESFSEEMSGPHNLFDIYRRLARHFAKWGAEHQVIDGNKMIEPSKSLEKAADKYALTAKPDDWIAIGDSAMPIFFMSSIRSAVKYGAEWQAKQMPMPEDTVLFQKGVEEGKRLMMEDAHKIEGIMGNLEEISSIDKDQLARSAASEWCRCFKCDGIINDTQSQCDKPNVTCLKWRDAYRATMIALGKLKVEGQKEQTTAEVAHCINCPVYEQKPKWKPSEEQMEALGMARELGGLSIQHQEYLYNLENDLKKLMEE